MFRSRRELARPARPLFAIVGESQGKNSTKIVFRRRTSLNQVYFNQRFILVSLSLHSVLTEVLDTPTHVAGSPKDFTRSFKGPGKFSPSVLRRGSRRSCLLVWRGRRIKSGHAGSLFTPYQQAVCGPALFHPKKRPGRSLSRGLWSYV